MAAWLEEVATARVDCAASSSLSHQPVVQASRGWRQRSQQRRSLPQRLPCSASGAVAWLQKHGRQDYPRQPSSDFRAETVAAAGKQRQSASRQLCLRGPGRRLLLAAPPRTSDEKLSPVRRPPRLERRPPRLEARCAPWHVASARGRARCRPALCHHRALAGRQASSQKVANVIGMWEGYTRHTASELDTGGVRGSKPAGFSA